MVVLLFGTRKAHCDAYGTKENAELCTIDAKVASASAQGEEMHHDAFDTEVQRHRRLR